jgi:uncharacterized membrane protein (UPF0127 family)
MGVTNRVSPMIVLTIRLLMARSPMVHFLMVGFLMVLAAMFRDSLFSAPAFRQLARAAAVAAGACLLMMSLPPLPIPPAHGAEQQTLKIASKTGVHEFSVELAVTAEETQRGLMFRRSVPEFTGMLFDFETDAPRAMWMKNTYVSLDMIFIQGDGRIRSIAENTVPESEKIIRSGGPVRAVLEVVGGTARKLGIKPGDQVDSPILHR